MTKEVAKTQPMYIVGAGGFGRECLDAARASGLHVDAFLDEHAAGGSVHDMPIRELSSATAGRFVVAIADPRVRRRLAGQLEEAGLKPVTVRHPTATVSPSATIDYGAVLLAGCYVSCDVRLGPHAHVNYLASIGHDTVCDAFVTVLPGANIAGGVHLGESATVGSNACVLPRLSVGVRAIVGAGAVVTRSVPDGSVRKGVPAR